MVTAQLRSGIGVAQTALCFERGGAGKPVHLPVVLARGKSVRHRNAAEIGVAILRVF